MKKFVCIPCLAAVFLAGCHTSYISEEAAPAGTDDAASVSDTNAVQVSATTGTEEMSSEHAMPDTRPDTAAQSDEKETDTGDAALDNTRNQDEIGENEILVVSFGTSYNDSRRMTIGAIEDSIEHQFTEYAVRRAFTSDTIIARVQERDGVLIDNVETALQRAVDNQVKHLVIQPTHLMDGYEYQELIDQATQYADAFETLSFGTPLLTSESDFKQVEQAIVNWTSAYDDGETAICFMGHGTGADSNTIYEKMQQLLTEDGYENYFIGTVEAEPSLDTVLEMVQAGDYKRVVLEPLMVVAGDHANNDMAGEEPDSWKSVFEQAGYEVTCLLRGLGENPEIQQIYAEHAYNAVAGETETPNN